MTDDEPDFGNFESQMGDSELPPDMVPDMVTATQQLKRLVWDMAPCDIAQEVAVKIGLAPASQDVEEMEHRQAHERMNHVMVLDPIITQWSLFASDAIRGAMMVRHGDEMGSLPVLSRQGLGPMVYQSVLAMLAEMLDMGLIHLGPGYHGQ